MKRPRNAGKTVSNANYPLPTDQRFRAGRISPQGIRNVFYIFACGKGKRPLYLQLNDRRIRVSRVTELEYALLGAGFPFRSHQHMDAWIGTLKEFMLSTSGIRRPGSASLDLAYVACGRYEGFWEIGLSPWDMAAGALIVLEAGGLVTDLAGGQNFLESGNILAGNPKIHAEMLRRLQPHLTEDLRH